MGLIFQSVGEILSCYHLNKTSFAVVSRETIITRDDVVSQRLKFGSAFLSSSWESKIALFF